MMMIVSKKWEFFSSSWLLAKDKQRLLLWRIRFKREEEEVVLALAVAEEAAAIAIVFNFNFNNSAPPHLQPKRDMIETA